jgi:Coenzyme PQQ synthesis protein D (PqqD)
MEREYTAQNVASQVTCALHDGWCVTAETISESAIVVAASDVLVSEFGNELVLLNLRDGVYYGLEEVGARLWALLRQPTTLPAIRDALVSEYEVEPTRCEREARALLGDLVARGLVTIQEQR